MVHYTVKKKKGQSIKALVYLTSATSRWTLCMHSLLYCHLVIFKDYIFLIWGDRGGGQKAT